MPRKLKVTASHGIKKLEIFTKRIVTSDLVGKYKSMLKGKGLEFDSYRLYSLSDDAKLIDWKASARINEPIIKEYVVERNLNIFLLIDVSSSMVFGSTEKLKNEYAAELASSLSYAILNVGDSLGYAFFSDNIFNINKPSRKTKLFYIISKHLSNPDIYGGSYDLGIALDKVSRLLKENSVIIIISDFIGLRGDWEKQLKKASFRHDVIGIMVRDPRDRELPSGVDMIRISDPFSDEELILDSNYAVRESYKEYVAKQENALINSFTKARASLLTLTTDKPFYMPLIKFFKMRKKWRK